MKDPSSSPRRQRRVGAVLSAPLPFAEVPPGRDGDRWQATDRVREELISARAEKAQLLTDRQVDAELSPGSVLSSSMELIIARLHEVAMNPWPHPDDIDAAAGRLLAGTRLADQGVVYLGEGAYLSGVAFGAVDRAVRELVTHRVPCYSDVMLVPDAVRVQVSAAGGVEDLGVRFVPARQWGLAPDGEEVYRACREDGHSMLDAARIAALVTSGTS